MSKNNFPILLALQSVFCVAYVIHGCISVARGRIPEATMDVGQGREQEAEASFIAPIGSQFSAAVADVNAIIAYASRAFVLFYMFQSIVAFMVAWRHKDLNRRTVRLVNFAFLAIICFLVFALGIPSG